MKQIITAILILVSFWVLMWGGCATDEECYQSNTNNYDIQTN